MNEFSIGRKVKYAGLVVTVRSLVGYDGRYIVEDSTGAFFPAHHSKLLPMEIATEHVDQAASFQNIASRAAMFAKGRTKGKSRPR